MLCPHQNVELAALEDTLLLLPGTQTVTQGRQRFPDDHSSSNHHHGHRAHRWWSKSLQQISRSWRHFKFQSQVHSCIHSDILSFKTHFFKKKLIFLAKSQTGLWDVINANLCYSLLPSISNYFKKQFPLCFKLMFNKEVPISSYY